jgi:serine/threonine protein kinase
MEAQITDERGSEQLLANRYRLQRRIGTGGMASVHEGEDTLLGRRVAVKLLHPQYVSDASFLARFEREARSVANLVHPGIVNVYDVGRDGEQCYIVMEFVEGRSVKEMLSSESFGVDRTIDIGVQVAKALDYAHHSGVVHRDVKPHNVIVTPRGGAKLVDFGIATVKGSSSVTESGAVLGTVHYVAPEQARGQPATPATDIYSLGCVLYEMATGRLPFDGDTPLDIATKHVSSEPIPPSRVNARVTPALERAILHAMQKDPARRPRDAGELARELLAFDNVDTQTTTYVPRQPVEATTARRTAEPVESLWESVNFRDRSDGWPLFVLALLALVLVAGLFPLWATVLRAGL